MNWQAVLDDPLLRDLPFKIELNRFGQILMSPASNRHGSLQSKLSVYLDRRLGGEVINECSIETSDGVKVADVAWASDEFIERNGWSTPFPEAPEICVEIASPSNRGPEMQHKIDLYLAKGAKEVWLCSEKGKIRVFVPRGEIDTSPLVGEKPSLRRRRS